MKKIFVTLGMVVLLQVSQLAQAQQVVTWQNGGSVAHYVCPQEIVDAMKSLGIDVEQSVKDYLDSKLKGHQEACTAYGIMVAPMDRTIGSSIAPIATVGEHLKGLIASKQKSNQVLKEQAEQKAEVAAQRAADAQFVTSQMEETEQGVKEVLSKFMVEQCKNIDGLQSRICNDEQFNERVAQKAGEWILANVEAQVEQKLKAVNDRVDQLEAKLSQMEKQKGTK